MRRLISAFIFALVLITAQVAPAAVFDFTIYTDYPAENVNGVIGDAPPGFEGGSWANDSSARYSKVYLDAATLFGRTGVTLGEIAEISYWTKKETTHVADPFDWFFQMYTHVTPGTAASNPGNWYGYRINSEPYFAANIDETAGEWTQWSTGEADDPNALRFFDSTNRDWTEPNTYYGGYEDPLWEDFKWSRSIEGDTFATEELWLIALGTGSAWNTQFNGLVDGLSISLYNNETDMLDVYNVNFEAAAPVPEPSTFLLLFAGLGGLTFFARRRKA